MNFQNDRYTLRFAESSDSKGISEVFKSGGFDGNLSVQYLREPDPVESFKADGEESRILVIRDNSCDRIVAVGGAVIRREYIKGTAQRCAYLTGLKILPEYRKRISFIAKSYEFLGESLSGCRCCYTTILDDNTAVVSMLEKKRRNMPEYRLLAHYTTYCFHGGKRLVPIERGNMTGFEELYEAYFAKRDLTPADTALAGFGEKEFYCFRENGRISACCFVGDQSRYKQYLMSSYGGIYKLVAKLPTQLFGYPRFPKAGAVIDHGAVSYLYVRNNDTDLCKRFLRSVAAESGHSLLIWGCVDTDPLSSALKSMKTVHYGSRLYAVLWGGEEISLTGNIGVEVALL